MAFKSIQNSLRRRAVNLRKGKVSGFTLLELLVVVAILAAIAGTATIALQDTDARASAAAHVAMMDELNKGIRTYRVLNKNQLPNNWDSLLDNTGALLANADGEILGIQDVVTYNIGTSGIAGIMADIGIENLRVVDPAGDPEDDGDCSDLQGLINSRGNAVVAGNLFMSPEANGCGADLPVADNIDIAIWTGGQERVLGAGASEITDDGAGALDIAGATIGAKVLMAVGAGPSSSLFDASSLGGLTSVPVYRHVAADQYNRFIVLFHVADIVDDGTGTSILEAADQVALAAIVDGAGDTKEEELGEWDGTRNTI